jgi:hypothetical protein
MIISSMNIFKDIWAYVSFLAMDTLCRAISCSSAGKFKNMCRASLKILTIMMGKNKVDTKPGAK